MRRSHSCAACRGGFAALLVLALLAAARPAWSQGTSGSLPDPISDRELERYAERLSLSEEQLEAARSRHNRYRADFARLRDGEIEEFLQTVGSMSDFRITFDREQVRRETKQAKDLMGKIKTLDDRFFDSLGALLTESQLALLPRIKQARERERCEQGVPILLATFHAAARNDLSELIGQLNLPPDVMEPVDVELMQYETRLTALAKSTYETAIDMRVTTFDRIEEQGYGAEALAEPGQAEGLLEAMFAAMNAAQAEISRESAKIAALNRRTLKNLLPYLSDEDSEQLRRLFYQRGYPGALTIHEASRYRFDAALSQPDLTDEQRMAVEALRADFRVTRDRLVEQMLDALDEQHGVVIRINPSPEQQAETEKREQEIEKLLEESRKLSQRTDDALDAILGRDLSQRVARRVAEQEAEGEEETGQAQAVMIMSVTAGGDEGGISTYSTSITLDADDIGGLPGSHSPLPGPIARDQLLRGARCLDLDEDDRTIVSALHDDYAEQFEAATGSLIGLLRAAEDEAWSRDEESGERRSPTVADVDRISGLRRNVMTAVAETDAELFDNIEALFGDEDRAARVERLRQARRREVYLRAGGGGAGGRFSFGGGGGFITVGGDDNREYAVDLAALVDELGLPDETLGAIDPVLVEYERDVTDVFRINYEAQRQADEHTARMTARAAQQSEDGRQRSFSLGGEAFEAAEAKRVEAREARERIVGLNRATRDRLLEALDTAAAERLRHAYDRAAWPGVFRDRLKLEDKFRAALALEDLTSAQRTELSDLVAEYREQRDGLCQAMLEFHKSGGEFDMQSFQERMREQEKLRFERQELGDRTLARLRAILTPEQVRHVGGLEAPARPR